MSRAALRTPAPWAWLYGLACPLVILIQPKAAVPFLVLTAIAVALGLRTRLTAPLRATRPLALPLAMLVLWSLASALWALAPGRAAEQSLAIGLTFLLALVLAAGLPPAVAEARSALARGVLAGVAITALLMVVELALGLPYHHLRTGHVEVEADVLNRAATSLALLAWPAGLALVLLGRARTGIALPLAVLALLALFESLSAQVGLAAGCAAALAAWAGRRFGTLVLGLGILGAIVMAPLALVVFGPGETSEFLPRTTQHRLAIWDFTLDRIAERPLAGWGFDSSRVMPNFGVEPFGGRQRVIPLHPHNAALQILLELGAAGLAIALAFLAGCLARVHRLERPARPFVAGFLASVLAIAGTAYGLWQHQWLAQIATPLAALLALAGRSPGSPE